MGRPQSLDRTRRQAISERSVMAYHEAGQAVVYHELGYEVGEVSIVPGELPSYGGYFKPTTPIDDGLIMILAGNIAQFRQHPMSRLHPALKSLDHFHINRLIEARAMEADIAEDAINRFVYHFARSHLGPAQSYAECMVDSRWRAIGAVARALMRNTKLDRAGFLDVISDKRRS